MCPALQSGPPSTKLEMRRRQVDREARPPRQFRRFLRVKRPLIVYSLYVQARLPPMGGLEHVPRKSMIINSSGLILVVSRRMASGQKSTFSLIPASDDLDREPRGAAESASCGLSCAPRRPDFHRHVLRRCGAPNAGDFAGEKSALACASNRPCENVNRGPAARPIRPQGEMRVGDDAEVEASPWRTSADLSVTCLALRQKPLPVTRGGRARQASNDRRDRACSRRPICRRIVSKLPCLSRDRRLGQRNGHALGG